MTLILGIDPGLEGALAWLDHDLVEVPVRISDVPVAKVQGGRTYLVAEIADLLSRRPRPQMAVLEYQQAFPGNAARATFRMGEGYGLWQGILAALGIPYTTVRPSVWKKALGIPAKAPKGQSRVVAQQLHPSAAPLLTRVRDHNRADALLLAHWWTVQGGRTGVLGGNDDL